MMIFTCKPEENFDPEILRQELVAAIGPDGWHLNTAGNTVEVVITQAFWDERAGVVIAGPSIPDIIADVVEAHFANGETRTHNAAIKKQIADLEATQTPRRVREGGQWMIDLEAQIAALRGQLQ